MASDTHQQILAGLSKDQVIVTGPARTVQNIEQGSLLRNKERNNEGS
jgi:hypothetical protein